MRTADWETARSAPAAARAMRRCTFCPTMTSGVYATKQCSPLVYAIRLPCCDRCFEKLETGATVQVVTRDPKTGRVSVEPRTRQFPGVQTPAPAGGASTRPADASSTRSVRRAKRRSLTSDDLPW